MLTSLWCVVVTKTNVIKREGSDMNIKSILVTANAGILSLGLVFNEANAAVVTLSDYLVTPNPGNSWTYITTMDSTIFLYDDDIEEFRDQFFSAGTEFTVTVPWYEFYPVPIDDVAELGVPYLFEEPNISVYLDIIPELTVPAGTFDNVLMMAWLDSNYVANSVNTDLGIDPSINEGVTDVVVYALGVGEIGGIGVMAESGDLDAAWELVSYSVVPVPIPAAIWLFGSGLIGLAGLARRRVNA